MITVSVEEISRRLAERAEAVCHMLFPGGKMERGRWVCGDVTGSAGKSLQVHLQGNHVGSFIDWAAQEDKGDLLDAWRLSKGITAAEAIREAKQWLGIQDPVQSRSEREYVKPPKNVTQVLGEGGTAINWLVNNRKLDIGIINRFRVEGSKEHKALAFPCYSPAGNLVNRSYRTLTTPKQVWQDKGCAPSLFGWQALDDIAYRESSVILCEGQIDAMTWTQWGFSALSIPNGSGMTWIEFEWDNLAAFDQVYLSCDQDGTGYDIVEKIINRLGRHRCMVISLPKKDANDCLVAGYNREDAEKWIMNAKAPGVKGLVVAADLEQRVLRSMEPKPLPFTLPFLKGRDPDGGDGFYPRYGEVSIWSGTTHHGKSTFLNYFTLALLSTDHRVMMCSLEMPIEKLIQRMIYADLRHKPLPEHVSKFIKTTGPNLIFADKVGYISQDDLLEMMRYSYQRYGVTHFFVDSLMRVSKLEEDYVAQGEFLNILQEFAKTSNTHVHLVAHPRKKDESRQLESLDVKGSSLIPDNADNIVFVIRNLHKEQLKNEGKLTPLQQFEMHDTEIRVTKQRETGWTGSFYLNFDPKYYSYSTLKKPTAGLPTRPT